MKSCPCIVMCDAHLVSPELVEALNRAERAYREAVQRAADLNQLVELAKTERDAELERVLAAAAVL